MKSFTSYQVLQAWLETQIGSAKNLRPKGYSVPGEGTNIWQDTCKRAQTLVESIDCYDMNRVLLIDWCQVGLEDLGTLPAFLKALDQRLEEYPFYPTTEFGDYSKKSYIMLTIDGAAKKLECLPNALRNRLDRLPVSLPFGSYKDDKKVWWIHPLDIGFLRSKAQFSEISIEWFFFQKVMIQFVLRAGVTAPESLRLMSAAFLLPENNELLGSPDSELARAGSQDSRKVAV